MKNLIILLSCLLFAGSVYGWGQKGHDVTAYIAECHLTPEAAQKIDKVLNGNATAATEFTSPKTPGYSDSLKGADNLKFNASKAKELWAKADAISKYDGQLTFSYNADGGAKPLYDAVVNQLKNNLGIDAATNPIPTFQEFRDAVTNRQMKGAFRTGWQPDYPFAENYLWQLYSTAAADGNGSNDGDYKNPAFDDLCKQAAAASSTDRKSTRLNSSHT